jgi:site-specific DNA-methyltransferase (adenine-specific)
MKNPLSNRVVLKDVLEGLRSLPDSSVDILICDPPYNIGKDFGNNKDFMPMDDYVEWSLKWLTEGMRVLSPTGTFYVYGFSEILAHLFVAADATFKRWLVWHYTNKNVASLPYWQRSHEALIVLGHGRPTFNRDEVREPYTDTYLNNAAGKTRAATLSRFSNGSKTTIYSAHAKGALPRDVIKVPALAGGAGARERAHFCLTCGELVFGKEKRKHEGHALITHPTQKPLELTTRLVKAAKNLIGPTTCVVLFAGSGAELVAARKEGCEVVGFEINPDYVSMGNAWLKSIES